MGFKCAIFGHRFEQTNSENNQQQDEDGNTVVVDVERKVCQRCGKQRDERRSTRVREDETSSTKSSQTDETSSNSSQSDSLEHTSETNSPNSTPNYTSGYSTQSYEETANAGIIMSSDTDTEQDSDDTTGTTQSSDDTTETTQSSDDTKETYRKAESQGAYIASSPEEHTSVVSCEKCGYEQYETQVSRESGDLCHKCGGWISVENAEP